MAKSCSVPVGFPLLKAKLDDIAQRIAWLKEATLHSFRTSFLFQFLRLCQALRRKAGVEQEHGDLALQAECTRQSLASAHLHREPLGHPFMTLS